MDVKIVYYFNMADSKVSLKEACVRNEARVCRSTACKYEGHLNT